MSPNQIVARCTIHPDSVRSAPSGKTEGVSPGNASDHAWANSRP
ncbi:hypothetical protein [Streptosporangium vulgare]